MNKASSLDRKFEPITLKIGKSWSSLKRAGRVVTASTKVRDFWRLSLAVVGGMIMRTGLDSNPLTVKDDPGFDSLYLTPN